jgi:hypothetical protein
MDVNNQKIHVHAVAIAMISVKKMGQKKIKMARTGKKAWLCDKCCQPCCIILVVVAAMERLCDQ